MPAFLISGLAFLFALGVIIFVHELGHLLAAKAFGVRALTFSLGFGKRLWGFQWGETEYRVAAIPFGGYVRLGGENPGEASDDPREFLNRPRWQRIVVYLAGPAMNVALAILLIAIVFMVGIEVPDLGGTPPVVGAVEEGSSAAAVGLQPGDRILALNGKEVASWQEVAFGLMTSPERPVALQVRRGQEVFATQVVPGKVPRYEVGDTAGLYPQLLPRVTQLVPGMPAAEAGFRVGDELRTVDGRPVTGSMDFVRHIEERAGETVRVEVLRHGRLVELAVVPVEQDGKGKIGVGIGAFQRYGPLRAIAESARYNVQIVRQTFVVLGKIFSRELSARSALSGPIEIAVQSGAAARTGFKYLLHLMGFISMSIAILNLFPIPILDGGQILILCVEGLIRRDLSLRFKELINQVGLVVILLLMLVVIYFDLARNLPGGLLPGT